MSTALAIAAVSRVLRHIVEASVAHYGLDGLLQGDVFVTAEPPREDPARRRINLFMYQAQESAHWRNNGLPAHAPDGTRLGNPPLALDLHYAVTAYAEEDLQSEVLLGCAMEALHGTPSLDRALILAILGQDNPAESLASSRLAEQLERIRIVNRNLSEESFSRLWAAFHVPYRASAFYQASVVLIQREEARRIALPVLHRPVAQAHASLRPPGPYLTAAEPPMAVVGQEVTLSGENLEGAQHRLAARHEDGAVQLAPLPIPPGDVLPDGVRFTVPAAWANGTIRLHLELVPAGDVSPRPTNSLPFAVLPAVTVTLLQRAPGPGGLVTVELDVEPAVRPGQSVALLIGSLETPGPQVAAATTHFRFTELDVPAAPAVLRLRVDRHESPWLDTDAEPPAFLASAVVQIP